MANEPIDHASTKLDASGNSALVLETTNAAPPKKIGSSSNDSAPKKEEKEKKNGLLKKTTATLTPPLGQFFINMILQIAAFAAAIAFGVFAVKSIDIARTANEHSASANSYAAKALEEARVANQVAMLAVCSQSGDVQNSSFAAFCVRVLNGAPMVMPDAASNLFTKISTATAPMTLATTSSSTSIVPTRSFKQSTHTYDTLYYSLPRTSSSQPTPKPSETAHPLAGSNPGDNKRKTLAIALPISLSLIFVIAIIAIVLIVWLKARSKRGNRQGQGPQRNRIIAAEAVPAEDHEDGDAASEYGHAQYEAREHGKDQADLFFEYEGWLMSVQDIHQKTNYLSNGKAETFQEIGGRPSGLISWTRPFRRIKSSISSNGKGPAPRKIKGRKIYPGRKNSAIEVEMKLLRGVGIQSMP